MVSDQISIHEVKIVQFFLDNKEKWFSNLEVSRKLKAVSARTVRAHTNRLEGLGVLERVEIYPGHRFRWKGDVQAKEYLNEFNRAKAAISN